jgi:hypothetical protein
MSNQNTVLLLPHQERFLQSPENFPDIRWHFLLAGYGAGKALPVDTIIPTPDGYKRFGDIKVGDKVFAANGKPTTVTGVFPQGFKDAYKVTLTDGRSAICCKEHLWGVYYYSHSDYKYKVMELGEMLKKGIRRPDPRYIKAGGKPRFWLPASPVCEYSEKELPVDPYVLGSFLGNGCMTSTSLALASNDEWQVAKVAKRLGAEYRKGKTLYTWLFRKDGRCLRTDHVFPAEWCKTAYYKHIPEEYLTAGLQQRKDLLQGLFDTDGCASVTKGQINVNYCTTSEELCKGIQKLLLSFGIVSSYYIRTKDRKHPCYTVTVNCTQEQKTWLFSLPRKLEKASSEIKKSRRNYDRVAIYSVEKLPQQMDMQCITVDDPSHLFLTEEHIVTHNTRSLAIATLKLCFDLEGVKDEGGLYAKIAVAGFTYAHLEQTFLIDFRAYLEGSKTPYHEDTKNHIITVGTVQVILLQLSEPGKIFGQSIYAALADEIDENTEEVMIEAMKSLSQRVRQILPGHRSPFIMAASTAQGMKGFYRLYCHYKKSGVGFVLIRARTQDNWYLPKEYIIDLWKNFTETERKVYMEGAFLSVTQGRVIPGFDWDRNFLPESDMDLELRRGERVYIGQDFNSGYNRGSAWVARNGTLHCIKRYDFPDPDDMANIYRYDFPDQDIFWLPDVTIKDQYPHFARDLRRNDIHIIHRSKSPLVEDSCFLISKLCAQGRILIHSQAREVAEAFSTASRGKDNKIPKGVGPNSPIHDIDGARYVCSYLALILPEFKDIRRGIMSHLASFRAGAEEMEERLAAVGQIGAGYTRIEGRAFTERA